MFTKISNTNFPRFKPSEKNMKPSPATYNASDSIEKQKWSSTRYSVGRDKKIGFFEYKAKKNKNPGPGTHKHVEKAYDFISRSSPTCATKRH